MNSNIERLLFYEREHLRSFDWTAEQTYHLEMRRRLNLALHLWGIVDGLDLLKRGPTPGVPTQFDISPGMAIDAYGREIFLFAPYPFSDNDFLANRIITPGTYKVWIAYTREPTRPPAPGYRLRDVKDQYTRWRESYRIIIANDPGPTTPPKLNDDLSDDPDRDKWLVRLGSLDINNVEGQLTITAVVSKQRTYVGLRAQRIVTPTVTPIPANPPVDPVLDNVSALDAPLSLTVVPNIFAEKNLVVGDNFRVDKNTITPQPPPVTPPTFPSPTGNLKVASDLFLRGNLYVSEAEKWVILKEYARTQAPDIQMRTVVVPLPGTPPPDDPSNGTHNFTLTSTLPNPSNAQMIAVLSGIEWQSKTKLPTWFAGVPDESPIKIAVSAATPSKQAGSTNIYDVAISWSIGPKAHTDQSNAMLSVSSITVSYIAVFFQ